MKRINHLFLPFLVILFFSCGEEAPDIVEDDPEEFVVLCENDPFQFSVEANGITMNSDSCWAVYIEDPGSLGLVDRPAVIKWEYPGYPEWNGANSLTFYYQTDTIESGTDYEAQQLIGVIQFDGTNGEMFGSLGGETLIVTIEEFNTQSKYICGSFEGKANFDDNEVVDVIGSFKGVLNP